MVDQLVAVFQLEVAPTQYRFGGKVVVVEVELLELIDVEDDVLLVLTEVDELVEDVE